MSGGDGVSSLNDLNEKYKQWMKNEKIEGGSTGTCNADSYYQQTNVKNGTDSKRNYDYYVCGDKDDYNCEGLNWRGWYSIFTNCKMSLSNSNRYDKCDNMAVKTTGGVQDFDMGVTSDSNDIYNPETNTGTTCSEASDCSIDNVNGQRPAYPVNKDILKTMNFNDTETISGLEPCPSGSSRELNCLLDGHDGAIEAQFVPGYVGAAIAIARHTGTTDNIPGCGLGDDTQPTDAGRFCARKSSDYDDSNIANCCLGSLADGPEVDTEGNPISTDYKSCPREFCVSRVAEGTESGSAGVNCDDPKTDKNASNVNETFCYKMSNECNTFFTEKCQDAFSDDYPGNLKQQCKDWAHIQPQEFVRIADSVCNINSPTNDYVDERAGRPTSTDLRHVKSVLNRPLCREYITSTENYPTESQKLKNLCKHYMKEQDDGSWEAQESLDHDNVLENICGCHYPSEYYTWYNRRYETREAGTCEDSEGNALNAISRSDCESGTPPGTWTPDAGAASITSALSDMMKQHPQCYYDKCISSMLYDVHNDAIPCSGNLQLCYQQMTQNNVMVGQDGNLSELPDMSALTGQAQQTCNQSTLSAPPPPSSDVGGGDSDDSGGFLSSIFGGSDDGSGDGTGDGSDNTNMIILIVVILLIVIIGVVVVVVLNKGKSTPQPVVIQQPLAA